MSSISQFQHCGQIFRPNGATIYHRLARRIFAFVVLVFAIAISASANAETRKLKLYYLHTGEKATIAYKKNGKFLPKGLKRINVFLRDWRRNEPTRMDPFLMDLVWEVYKKTGSKDYIHVISGYRSPATNNMLRKRGRGVAKRSQHTLGKALDFFLPDVKLAKLRNIGLVKQVGGVGYYPKSGSPFIHLDTGRVRHWPRMSRKQLVRVFPSGKTLHVPTDGKPLVGYNQAVAAFNARKSSTKKVELATGGEKERKTFFQRLAALRNNDDDEGRGNTTPVPRPVKTTTSNSPPVPVAPVTPIDTPQAPTTPQNLPIIASVPIPRSAPRETILVASSNVGAAPENSNVTNTPPIPTIDDSQPLDSPVFNIPVPINRPQPSTIVVAANDAPLLSLQDVVATQPTNILATNVLAPNDSATQERARLLALAKNQLRTKLLTPPRPAADLGSSFQTALLPTQEPTPASGNPVLTRTLEVATTPTALDDNLIASGVIAVPQKNPVEITPTVTASATVPKDNEPFVGLINGDGDIPLPQKNPVVLAALENSNAEPNAPSGDEIAAVTAFPVKRPQLLASNSPIVDRANAVLATAENEGVELASKESLAAMMAKQTKQLTADQDTSENEVSPIILAAIPTPAPRQLNDANPPVTTPRDIATIIAPPKPLDEFSLTWYEQNRTGKFVLAAAMTVDTGDHMRAPAYGRAAIRQSPETVLSAGFKPSGKVQNAMNFRGKALNFQPFTKFN